MRVLKLYVFLLLLSTAQALSDCEALIANLAKRSTDSPLAFPKLALIEQELGQRSLIDIQKESHKDTIQAHNKKTLEALAEPQQKGGAVLKGGVTFRQADLLVRFVGEHPTHGSDKEARFDPDGCFGFCFGRATLIHSEALSRNVPPYLIKKIWAVGSLEERRWEFHVSALIKAESKSGWWALDPIFHRAMDVRNWILQMESFSDDDRMMFFVTEANRFSVHSARAYSTVDLLGDGKSDFYNGYFKSYLEGLLTKPPPEPFLK